MAAILKALPEEIRRAAERCVLSIEDVPGGGPMDESLEGGELGLFEGACLLDDPGSEEVPRIRIFVGNLWDWVEADEQDFRDEVGTTYLHELGHYLGWDEDEIDERGLA